MVIWSFLNTITIKWLANSTKMPVGVCIMVLTNICKPTTTVEPQNLEPSNSIIFDTKCMFY